MPSKNNLESVETQTSPTQDHQPTEQDKARAVFSSVPDVTAPIRKMEEKCFVGCDKLIILEHFELPVSQPPISSGVSSLQSGSLH